MRYFIDCEFDGYRGPLISMALVRDDGRSFHFYDPEAAENVKDPWVAENVAPILRDCPEPPTARHALSAAYALQDFLEGDERPHIVADWPAGLIHFCALIETSPGVMLTIPNLTLEVKRVDAYPSTLAGAVQHNCWWDALALRQKVLELEVAQGGADLQAERPELKPGDTVTLKGQGPVLTVLEPPMDFAGAGPEVAVAWFNDQANLNQCNLPTAALLRC